MVNLDLWILILILSLKRSKMVKLAEFLLNRPLQVNLITFYKCPLYMLSNLYAAKLFDLLRKPSNTVISSLLGANGSADSESQA